MSVAKLLKERERLQEQLKQTPAYLQLQRIEDAIRLLQELDGGAAAETKVRQLGKMVGIDPSLTAGGRGVLNNDLCRALAEALAEANRPMLVEEVGESFFHPGRSLQKEKTRIYSKLLKLQRWGVATGELAKNGPRVTRWSLTKDWRKKLDAQLSRQGKMKAIVGEKSNDHPFVAQAQAEVAKQKAGPKNLERTQVTVIDPPEALKGMPKDTPLNEALLAIAMHTPGNLDHFAGAAVGLGIVQNDWPRRRIGIVLRGLVARKLLKKANGGYALSAKGTQAIAEKIGAAS